MGTVLHKHNTNVIPFLDEIAEHLWSDHAAIMVGAGFSQNASKNFPDWKDLGDIFYEKLYSKKPENVKYQSVSRLASLVQASLKKQRLEDILIENIPDLEVNPTQLHVKLLKLPWTDVFTTNYDTLLERAKASVYSHKYDVVVNNEDLLNSERPRIIKLHGSFPSQRPFIITEEDYRHYPKDFAPFVNTVRQALLENILCLIGFSGDDPNFLEWIGWIRDNLKRDYGHNIYLIGVFKDISEAEVKILHERNIVLVNLAGWCRSSDNHYAALDKLFAYLLNKKSDFTSIDWPDENLRGITKEVQNDKTSKIINILEKWKKTREGYPGWCITPESSRDDLWINTKDSISCSNFLDDLPDVLDLKFTYELNWRLEKCLHPLRNDLSNLFNNLLQKYWPFPSSVPQSSLLIAYDDPAYKTFPWHDIRSMWLHLALSVLRSYREQGLSEKWRKTYDILADHFQYLTAEHKSFLYYERVLYFLFASDIPEVEKIISEWPTNEALPFWEAKRAGILAELGRIDEAEKILISSLENVRSQLNLRQIKKERLLVSHEAYIMYLLKYVSSTKRYLPRTNIPEDINEIRQIFEEEVAESSETPKNSELNIESQDRNIINSISSTEEKWNYIYQHQKKEYKHEWNRLARKAQDHKYKTLSKSLADRWNELKKYKCDPSYEWQIFQVRLERPPIEQPNEKVIKEFDIGSKSWSIHFGTENSEVLSAYAFLRFCEEAGIPFRMRNASFASDIAKGTLKRIYKFSSYWALATLVRIGDEKTVAVLFNRESLNILTTTEVDNLFDWYLETLKKTQLNEPPEDKYCSGWYSIQLSRVLPEILSRLCCKCSLTAKNKLLLFLLEVYKDENKRRYKGIGRLFKRLLSSYSAYQQMALIPQLLAFPILEQLDPLTAYEFHNPFTFLDNDLDTMKQAPMPALAEERIDEFLACANSQNPFKRKWAIFTLIRLYELDLISKGRILTFRDALYAQCDDFGFPKHTDFYKFAFFDLPYPDNLNLRNAFKRYISETSFPIQGDSRTFAMSSQDTIIFHELIHSISVIEWTTDEITKLFDRLLECWDTDKNNLVKKEAPDFLSIRESFVYRFSMLTAVVAKVIAPALNKTADKHIKNNLKRIISELNEYGIPSVLIQASCVHIFPQSKKKVIQEIEKSLHTSDSQQVINGLESILLILQQQGKNYSAKELERLYTFVGQKIYWRHKIGLKSALNTMSHLVKDFYEQMNEELQGIVLQGLEHLAEETNLKGGNAEWDFAEKLEIRQAAALLAYLLYAKIIEAGADIPNALKQWKNICSSESEFAEIKNQWLILSE